MDWTAPALGASGAVTAMVVAAASMRPRAMVLFIVIPLKLWVLAAILVAKDVFFSERAAGERRNRRGAFDPPGRRGVWLPRRPPALDLERSLAAIERKRAVADMERQLSDDARMDQLMAKISREGIDPRRAGRRGS